MLGLRDTATSSSYNAWDRGKPRALGISLGLHVAAFFGLMYAPPMSLPTLPAPSPSEYQQAFAGKEDKIVWYKFRDLPDVSPKDSPRARQPLHAAVVAKQAIVSSPKNAPKHDQVVLTPVPAIELPPLELPNLIAVKLPPKQFTTPPDLVRPDPAQIAPPEISEAPPEQLEAAKLPAAHLPARPYVPPQVKAQPFRPGMNLNVRIEAPPDAPRYEPQSTISTKLPVIRLPSRAYVPPPPQAPPERRRIADATETEVAAVIPNTPTTALPAVKLPARAYVPPPSQPPLEKKSVAPPQIEAPAGEASIAIATLKPAVTAVKLPAASSPAQFSAGEKVRPDGATADGAGKGITVPDLYAHAGADANAAKPDLLALTLAAPDSKEFMDAAMRRRQLATGPVKTDAAKVLSSNSTSGSLATRVSNAPDPRFNGRDVYMMAIQMTNLTSYSGHWLMWYAARSGLQADVQSINAPVPRRKVDPRYVASAVADHVEGRVQLYCVIGREGTVRSIELLHGADDRLNQSAEEALSKWEFYPAMRDGLPVEVDVVVEIPFTLAPPPLK
jgi:TonB family protein